MSTKTPACTVADFCTAMDEIAPPALAQDWDNVGLIAGDPNARVHRIMLCIDLTPPVVEEVLSEKTDVVMAYHPPIFKPISSLRATSLGTDAAVFQCIRGGTAIYAAHTALDAADGGMNDVLASLCGSTDTRPLEYLGSPAACETKIVVFVPQDEVEHVAEAMFTAGAGRIGDYTRCAFRLAGTGSFLGGEGTDPTVGQRGRLEFVDEIRLEMVVPEERLPAVVGAMIKAHSYEEPAFDIYPLRPRPISGIGRMGPLARPTMLGKLAAKLKRTTGSRCVQIVGSAQQSIDRVIVVVGAAGGIALRHKLQENDAIITGEIRHHDALAIRRMGGSAIALGHWSSERPGLASLAKRLAGRFPTLDVQLSTADEEPFKNL